MQQLREWQKEASIRFLECEQKDFLARITPGGGKTFWALKMAAYLRSEGSVDQIAIIVPSVVIKHQWQEEAQRHFSLVLSDIDEWSDESAGFITTYQKIATGQMPEVMREFCQESRVLAIFDEIHHGSDHNTWGTKLRTAFELAERRLCLTGTPFRSDGREVPFVQYVDDVCAPDYSYTYGQAVADDIVRQLRFQLVDGISSWDVEGQTEEALLSESKSPRALNAAIEADKDFVATVILAAEQKRRELPEGSACLVLAKDTKHASDLAKAVRSLTGHKSVLVHSNTDQPAKRIADFRESSTPWIVSVRMISEGVDIPRIRCLCWLTNYSTELFFEQAVARCVRGRANEEAWVFLPETPQLAGYAANFENAELPALKPQGSESRNIATGERSRRTVEYLDSEGFLSGVISAGKLGSVAIRRVSEERKIKQAEYGRQRWQNSEYRAKMAEYRRQRRQDPEYRAKMAEYELRRRQDPDTKAKREEYRRQRRRDPDVRAKRAERELRRRQDPEYRAKMKEYQRRHYARKKAERLQAEQGGQA